MAYTPLLRAVQTFALVLDHLAVFNPHSLSMVMWAAVALGQRVPVRLVHAMYGATTPSLHAYPPRSVACLVWAVSVGEFLLSHDEGQASSASMHLQAHCRMHFVPILHYQLHPELPCAC